MSRKIMTDIVLEVHGARHGRRHKMIAEFHEEGTKIVVEVDGVRGVLTEVGDDGCEGCTLSGFCSTMHGAPCRMFSGSNNYMFVQESLLKKGGKDEQKDKD